MILGFFFLLHFLEVLSVREGFFAKKGGVSLVRNRDLRPAAKANPTIQQSFERFQKYNRLKNLSQGSLDFYAAKGRSFFRFLGDTEQPINIITEETVEDYIFYMSDEEKRWPFDGFYLKLAEAQREYEQEQHIDPASLTEEE